MITCALTKEQISDLANDVYAHINADPATFDIDVYMNDLFNLVATSTGSVSRAALFVQTAFAIIGQGRSIPVFKSVLDATPIRETALVDMINKFTNPVEGLEKVFLYIGFRAPGTIPSTAATSATPVTPTPAEEEEEEEKTTKLVPNEEISIGDITYEDFELLPDTDAAYQALRDLKTKLDTAFANAQKANPTLYTDISKFLSTSTAVSIINQYNTALATVAPTGTTAKTKPANIKLGTTGEEISTDMSLLYLRGLLKSLKAKLATLTTRTPEYTALANDINALDAFINQYALYTNKDIFLIEQEIERVLDSIRQRMASVEKNPDGTPVKSSEAYIIKEEEYARVSLIVEKILERYFRQEPFGLAPNAEVTLYLTQLANALKSDRATDVRAHMQRELVSITGGKVSSEKAATILDRTIQRLPDFLDVLASSTTTVKVQTNYLDTLSEEIMNSLYDASREVGNEVDEAVRDFVADIGATSIPETSLLSKAAAKQLQEILEPFKQTVGEIASNTDVIYSDNTKVAGQMDLLFIDENSEWWIVDVKTGKKSKWSKYSTGADAYRTYIKNALQQIIYKKILQDITGLDKINLGILPLEVEYDSAAKISSIKTPAKVGTQKLTADAPFITINVNEKHVVFTSDVPSDTTKKEMTLEEIVDEALGNRLKEVTEEETGAEEEEPSGEETGEGEEIASDIEADNTISNGDKIISVQTKPVTNEITDTTEDLFILPDNNPEGRIHINMEPLKDILVVPNNTLIVIDKKTGKEVFSEELNPEGAVIFESMQGRLFVVANINGQLVPFYKSSAGTSGKTEGAWYPFFGYTGSWLVKGSVDKTTGKMSYSPEIDRVTDLLNENLVFPDKYIGRASNSIKNTKGEVIIDMNQFYKINRLWQKGFKSQTGNRTNYSIKGLKDNTTSESGVVALITGLNSTDLDSSKTPKELSEWFNLISKNAELAALEGTTSTVSDVISDEVYNAFIDNNIVPESVLNSIADKVIKKEPLSQRETAIFTGKTSEINEIIRQKAAEGEDAGGETTTFTNENTVSLTEEQETELTKIDNSRSSDYVDAKVKLVRELLNSGQELYGEYFESGSSRSLILKVNGKTLRVGVFLDANILLNQGDIIKLSLQKESVVPGEAFDVIYEDVVNLVDTETNDVVGRMRVSDATIFNRASEQRQNILGMLGAVTNLSQLSGVVKEAFNFRLQFPTSTINQELSDAIEAKRAELALLPDLESISKNTYFFKKGSVQSVDTAYKVVSYNEAKGEIVISLVNNPSVEEKMNVKAFQESFDLLLGVEGEPVVLSQEEQINLELTNENLDAIKSDPRTTFGENNPYSDQDDSSLEDDIGKNSKC